MRNLPTTPKLGRLEARLSGFTPLNVIGCQLCWVVLVATAGGPLSQWGLGVVAAWVVVHLALTPSRKHDLVIMACTVCCCPWLDAWFKAEAWIVYAGTSPAPMLAPWWIYAVWLNFSLSLNHGFRWLGERPLAAALLGGVAGPLAYAAGVRLGAAEWSADEPLLTTLVLALSWAMMLPGLGRLALIMRRTSQLLDSVPGGGRQVISGRP